MFLDGFLELEKFDRPLVPTFHPNQVWRRAIRGVPVSRSSLFQGLRCVCAHDIHRQCIMYYPAATARISSAVVPPRPMVFCLPFPDFRQLWDPAGCFEIGHAMSPQRHYEQLHAAAASSSMSSARLQPTPRGLIFQLWNPCLILYRLRPVELRSVRSARLSRSKALHCGEDWFVQECKPWVEASGIP